MTDSEGPGAAVERARRFVAAHYPTATVAVLGGSSATGRATATSDLDVIVVLPQEWGRVAFVETVEHEGQLVEAFVYGPGGLPTWLEKDRRARRPVLDRMLAEGLPLTTGTPTDDLVAASRAVLSGGPTPLDATERRVRAYAVSALLDDLVDAGGAERYAVAATLWREASELSLLLQQRWLGAGKWLVRELLAAGDPYGLVRWAGGAPPDADGLVPLVRDVLDAAGGYLQAGLVRGERPESL